MSTVTLQDPVSLAQLIRQHRTVACPSQRLLVAIVGAPAAGKSSLVKQLVKSLEDCRVVPMDGFHLDNRLLEQRGQGHIKGAPETFDSEGLLALLRRIRQDEDAVFIPVFDRHEDLSRAAAEVIEPRHRTVLVEGNYLLLNVAPWSRMTELFDLRVMIRVPEHTLEERLIARWLTHGLDQDSARARALANDIPNGHRVLNDSLPADVIYRVS